MATARVEFNLSHDAGGQECAELAADEASGARRAENTVPVLPGDPFLYNTGSVLRTRILGATP